MKTINKKIWKQRIIYLSEGLIFIGAIYFILATRVFEPVSKFEKLDILLLAILAYEFLTNIFSINAIDEEKDELIAYKRIVQKAILALGEGEETFLRDRLLIELDKTLSEYEKDTYMIDSHFIESIKKCEEILKESDSDNYRKLLKILEYELIDIEHRLSYLELKWHKSIVLRKLK